MSLHLELGAAIETAFASALESPVEQKQDAMIVRLNNGLTLTVRYAAPDAYSMRWTHGDGNVEIGIDTAPLHRALATFPNHLHTADGGVTADPLTRPDASPEDNVRRLVRALIDDPALGATVAA